MNGLLWWARRRHGVRKRYIFGERQTMDTKQPDGETTWKGIWERKGASTPTAFGLHELLAINGYDTAASGFDEAAWRAYVERIAARVGIAAEQDVCEIGCGAGAFLLPLNSRGVRLWGVDYAAGMIDVCRAALPAGIFTVAEACRLPFAPLQFDVVLCNSVFIYFPDLDYAENAIAEVARVLKPGGCAGLLDLNDARKKELYITIRRQKLGVEQYELAYSKVRHLFFEPDWLKEQARKYGLSCVIENQTLQGYGNAPFRFNVFLEKV
jgi:ubiquinone/menaquinone biosynthesis C-methylase UbiE